jgi:YgiT-type zinc finger domain-containing protein
MTINLVNPTQKDRCVFCGGEVEGRSVTFTYHEGDKCLLVENVPAEVCRQCGEETYAPDVADELLRLARGLAQGFARDKFRPVRTVEVPVFSFRSSPESSK